VIASNAQYHATQIEEGFADSLRSTGHRMATCRVGVGVWVRVRA